MEGFLLAAEGLHHFLALHHLLHKAGLLPPHLGLEPEHIVGVLGDKRRHHQGNRGDHHHHGGDAHVDAEHKAQGAHNGDHPGKQLGKAHEQAVGKLVHIGDHPADHLPGRVGVHIVQGQHLQLAEGGAADIPHHPVGDPVVEQVHDPLAYSRHCHHHAHFHQNPKDGGQIHLAGAHNQVHRIPCQNGNVQAGGHRHRRQKNGQRH